MAYFNHSAFLERMRFPASRATADDLSDVKRYRALADMARGLMDPHARAQANDFDFLAAKLTKKLATQFPLRAVK